LIPTQSTQLQSVLVVLALQLELPLVVMEQIQHLAWLPQLLLAVVVAVLMVLDLELVLTVVLEAVVQVMLAPPAVLVHLVKEITEVLATLYLKTHL
jgi:hypothetical protein